jgi:hypothetical protein
MVLRSALVALGAVSAVLASTDETLKSCLKYALTDSGTVAFAGDLFYQTTVNPYNLNIPVTPAAVTVPTLASLKLHTHKMNLAHAF